MARRMAQGRWARWSRRLVVAGPAALVLAMALAACGDDGDSGDSGDSGDPPIDDAAVDDAAASEFQPACDRLADLGNAILGASDAATPAEVEDAVQTAVDDFVAAAGQSSDGELSELANTVDEAFSTYLTAGGIDAREAGNQADIALDRSTQRCLELGATNDFPQEPNP